MNNERIRPSISPEEVASELEKIREKAASEYRKLLSCIYHQDEDKEINPNQNEPRIIIPATPHKPGIELYIDGSLQETNDGIYQRADQYAPSPLEGRAYIIAAEKVIANLLPNTPESRSGRCI